VKTFALHLLLITLATIFLAPILWLIITACGAGSDDFSQLLHGQPIFRWLLNSIFLASAQTVLVVIFSSMAGFALAKYRFFGKRPLVLVMLVTMLLPPQVLLPGIYELIFHLGWINSYWAIVLPGAVSVFGAFLFRQAMLDVPDELLQCARLDGCGELRLWWEISLPLVRPMVAAFTLLSFLGAWNSFLWPQIVLQDENKFPLTVALNNLSGQSVYQQHPAVLMLATLVGILPVVVLFFALQKDFIGSLKAGAIKG
jgi:ABC-type glycerol-3-phosphate transport system permease component